MSSITPNAWERRESNNVTGKSIRPTLLYRHLFPRGTHQFDFHAGGSSIQGVFNELFHNTDHRCDYLGTGQEADCRCRQLLHPGSQQSSYNRSRRCKTGTDLRADSNNRWQAEPLCWAVMYARLDCKLTRYEIINSSPISLESGTLTISIL